MSRRRLVHLSELLGRPVRGRDGRIVGRIEEVRVERRHEVYEVDEYLLGTGALFERLGIVRRWLKHKPAELVVRWDQLDISRPRAPALTCAVDELKHE